MKARIEWMLTHFHLETAIENLISYIEDRTIEPYSNRV
jgi:hypothetical protein